MYKKHITDKNTYAERLQELLLSIPGTTEHTEEGMVSGAIGLRVLGSPIFIKDRSYLYMTKACSGSSMYIRDIDSVSHVYYTEKYISIFKDDEKTHVLTICKTATTPFLIAPGNFFRNYGTTTAVMGLSDFINRPMLLRDGLNRMYASSFCAPEPIKNHKNELAWIDSREMVHENIKIFHGYTNIDSNQKFLVSEQEWFCIDKGKNCFLAIKKE